MSQLLRLEDFHAVVRDDLSLWQILENREKARMDWIYFAIESCGTIPAGIMTSKTIYHLIYVYRAIRGPMASGDWLGLHYALSYTSDLDDDVVMIISSERDALAFLVGGKMVEINYEGIERILQKKEIIDA